MNTELTQAMPKETCRGIIGRVLDDLDIVYKDYQAYWLTVLTGIPLTLRRGSDSFAD